MKVQSIMYPSQVKDSYIFPTQETFFQKDFLYLGLPCVWDEANGKYCIFSPYNLKMTSINPDVIHSNDTRKKLENLGFFGIPANQSMPNWSVKIGLILTTQCNLRCKYCFVVPEAQIRFMFPEYAIRIIKEKITSETEEIYLTFFGGEPTLNMETLKKVVRYVEGLGIKTHFLISTNGSISPHNLDYLIEKNFTFIVSSDGRPEVTDEQRPMLERGKKVSKEIEHTIKRLAEEEVLFKVRATLTHKNIFFLRESMNYWASLGVKFVHFEPLSPCNNSIFHEIKFPPPKIYVEEVIDALNQAERLGLWIISSPYMNLLSPSTYFCTTVAGEEELYTPDGSISACYRVQELDHSFQEFIVGRYNNESDRFIRYNNQIKYLGRINVSEKKECHICAAKYICAGGCPFRNKTVSGSLTGFDSWMCYVKKALVHDAVIRIDRALDKGKPLVVFGESVFESLLRRNSIKSMKRNKEVEYV